MKHMFRYTLPLFLVAFLGAGCAIFPRVVRVPPAPNEPAVAQSPQPAPEEVNSIAYLKLNGGAASVTRGNSTAAGADDVELESGDRVQVTSGTVSLIYPNAGETQLDTGSNVTIVSDGSGTGSVFAELQVASGEVWTRFERLLGTDEHFSVQANGVVATVRGTGFGVLVDGDAVDVQVAEHSVDVTSADDESAATQSQQVNAIHLTEGQGFRITRTQLHALGIVHAKGDVRTLTTLERSRKEFKFGSLTIPRERLVRPANPVRLQAASICLTNISSVARTYGSADGADYQRPDEYDSVVCVPVGSLVRCRR